MDDIAPELLEKMQRLFREKLNGDKTIAGLYQRVEAGTATYEEAQAFAQRAGEILAGTFRQGISAGDLPDGRMYYNIAKRVLPPMFAQTHTLVADVAVQVQEDLNRAAGIGIKAISPELESERVEGFVNRVSAAERYEDAAWVLDEPVVRFAQSVVDNTIKANADFHYKAGMRPKITRTVSGKCCDWCADLAGTYDYGSEPKDIYRRHAYCRCSVLYEPGTGKVQDVWSKKTYDSRAEAAVEQRKYIGTRAESDRERLAGVTQTASQRWRAWEQKTEGKTAEEKYAAKFGFTSKRKLEEHYQKHKAEYPGLTAKEYEKYAVRVAREAMMNNGPEVHRSDGSIARYNEETNDFVVINEGGTIRTLFKPENGREYWEYEKKRN